MSTTVQQRPPLGSTYDPHQDATTFRIFSVGQPSLCLYDSAQDGNASREIPLTTTIDGYFRDVIGKVHAITVPKVRPGQLYGYRIHGTEYDPRKGQRSLPSKVLSDPYAKVLGKQAIWNDALFGFCRKTGNLWLPSDLDSAPFAPLGMVVGASNFNWEDDRPPRIAWEDLEIYEGVHVRGQTILHPKIQQRFRGTYSGLARSCHLKHLKKMANAVELLPVHAWMPRGSWYRNYWGYDSLAFFALHRPFSAYANPLETMNEFKQVVKAMHRAGLEVILDVVYNHSCEGDERGITVSFRGLSNQDYYLLCGDDHAGSHFRYVNRSGCGNTLNTKNPVVLQMILDSLLWWIEEFHIDGFRFDLATALSLGISGFTPDSEFLKAVGEHPVLSKVKLIAEPWDTEECNVGGFPAPWHEWNKDYRDIVRQFWRGDAGKAGDFADAIAGSRRHLFPQEKRSKATSVNFVTCHDGFTLDDLVSYTERENEANGEGNRDGCPHNYSSGYGVNGKTTDRDILAIRLRQKRAFITTLAVSYGVMMTRAGDSQSQTYHGNNNPWCHDSELTWIDWHNADAEFLDFWEKCVAMRRQYGVLRYADDATLTAEEVKKQVFWFDGSGQEMTESSWQDAELRTFGVLLSPPVSRQQKDSPVILLFNAHWEHPSAFTFPEGADDNGSWVRVLDTAINKFPFRRRPVTQGYTAKPRSVCVFSRN